MRRVSQPAPYRRLALAVAGTLLVALVGWQAGWGTASSGLAADGVVVLPAPPAALPTASLSSPPQTDRAAASAAEAVARVARLWQDGPLRGTQWDGDWGTWVDGRLQPSRSLRLRFDYLLSGLGGAGSADLRLWIARQVRLDRGSAAVDAVLAVWDGYLVALQSASQVQRDPADAQAWQRASAQLAMARRQALGPAWAHAFFADEEREAEAFVARYQLARTRDGAGLATTAAAAPAAPTDNATLLEPAAASLSVAQRAARDAQRLAAFGPEAAERLRAEDAAQAAWAQQLAAVRGRLVAIAADQQLSPLQRQQAQEAEITRHYSGSSLIRARALLADGP